MGGNLFKTIVAIILLAALAFVAGSLAADGAKQALMPIGILVGLFVLVYLGKNCWWLVYAASILTPLLGISLFKNFPVAYALSAVLLFYWFIMYVLGQVKITWYGLAPLDVITGVFVVYFMTTWIRHPVYLNVMVDDLLAEGDVMMGGRPYVWAVAGTLVYIFISIVPIKLQTLIKTLKILVWLVLPLALLGAVKIYLLGGGVDEAEGETMGEAIMGGRFGAFMGVSRSLYIFLVCKYSVMGFVVSPLKAGLLLSAVCGMALSGFRELMLNAAVVTVVSQWLHRQLALFILLCVGAYGALLYLSSETLLEDLPYGVKRVLSAVPGVEFKDNRAARDAKGSIAWRVEMWKWALTPSMGYIKDYVWGDGFGLSAAGDRGKKARANRGMKVGSNRDYAAAGMWHSGPITALHRTGGVGLAIVVLWSLIVSYYILRLCAALRRVPGREYLYFYLVPVIGSFFLFYISAGSFEGLFDMFFQVAIMKATYVLARREGLIKPLFSGNQYVPMMHQGNALVEHPEGALPRE